jgi:hypothetical protein
MAWIWRDTARQTSNLGGANISSAHRRIAVVEGIAERTPKARAS